MTITTRKWNPLDFLQDEESIRLYVEAAQMEAPGDAAFMAAVLGNVAQARNLTQLARQSGIARETLYKITRGEGNPTMESVGKLARALGLRLSLAPLPQAECTA